MTMRARQVCASDFERFDLIVAMDAANRQHLTRLAGVHAAKVHLLREFDPSAPRGAEVPDPYYGGSDEFAEVAEMMERAVEGILGELGSLGD